MAHTATQLGNNADTCHICVCVCVCGLVEDRRRSIVAGCRLPTSDKLIGHFGPKGNSATKLQVASCELLSTSKTCRVLERG